VPPFVGHGGAALRTLPVAGSGVGFGRGVGRGVARGVGRAVGVTTGGAAVGSLVAPGSGRVKGGVEPVATVGGSLAGGAADAGADGLGAVPGSDDGTTPLGLGTEPGSVAPGVGATEEVGAVATADGAGARLPSAIWPSGRVGPTIPAVSATVARMMLRRPMATTRRAR
jgi:hypothetical protein